MSIAVVDTSATTMESIIGPLKSETMKAAAMPARPAYHIAPKSVSARGNMRAPSAATGRRSMHLRTNLGRRESADEAK